MKSHIQKVMIDGLYNFKHVGVIEMTHTVVHGRRREIQFLMQLGDTLRCKNFERLSLRAYPCHINL